jgi:hypothetical protein
MGLSSVRRSEKAVAGRFQTARHELEMGEALSKLAVSVVQGDPVP